MLQHHKNMTTRFYCLTFHNPERRSVMQKRFDTLSIPVTFQDGVEFSDPRISRFEVDNNIKRLLSCTYGHLDAIQTFLEQSKDGEYGVFCEDDVYLHTSLPTDLPAITETFRTLDLDVLLLGFLTPYPISNQACLIGRIGVGERKVYTYPDDQWGAQMFMLSRAQAKYLVEKYAHTDYVERSLIQENRLTPFSPDWIYTKKANKRALVYPMYAVEEGVIASTDPNYVSFHRRCHICNYNPDTFV